MTGGTRFSIDTVDDLAALFSSLGYDCELRRVSSRQLAALDIPLFFASACGTLDLYFSPAVTDEDARSLVSSLSERNALRVVALAAVLGDGAFALHVGHHGSATCCRIDPALSESYEERLRAMRLLDDRFCDPGELLVQVTSRERITRDFFKRFSRSVKLVSDALEQTARGESKESCRRHAILLLSRILFLYFVQRRGWLDGGSRYLLDRLRAAERDGREFYSTVLLPLFFGCLNTPRAERQRDVAPLGDIPYLNGGLFQPSRFELANASTSLGNDIMSAVLATFEPFTFVVDERDAGGSAVDPEMLGRVFESLMAEDERLRSGTFYTPREVVDEMVEEALFIWIADGDHQTIELLQRAVRHEVVGATEASTLLERVRGVRVLDPACGSGAFLLAALYMIERVTRALERAAGQSPELHLRRRIVEQSLFGVDLKPEAVRLCELRLWLAIVVGEEASTGDLLPLPNLDRNVFQGNTLFSPIDSLTLDRRDLYHDWVYALRGRRQMIDSYRHAEPQLKRVLGDAIRRNDRELVISFANRAIELYLDEAANVTQTAMFNARAAAAPAVNNERLYAARELLERAQRDEIDFFSFDVHFAHVIAEGGFDVIVGNPPWVRHSRLSFEERRKLSDRYALFRGAGSSPRQSDLAIAFCEKAMTLAADGGVVSFLLPSKVLAAVYAHQLRQRISSECELRSLRDYSSNARSLFDADTFPLALTFRRTRPARSIVTVKSEGREFQVPQSSIVLRNGAWSTAHPQARTILEKLRREFPSLEQVLGRAPLMGVKTGANRLFMLEDVEFRNGSAVVNGSIEVPLDALCRTVRGRDLERWKVRQSSWMLWSPGKQWSSARWLSDLAAFHGVSLPALQLSFVRPEHFGTKVAWKDLSRGLQAAVLPATTSIAGREFPLIPNQTLYFLDMPSLSEAYVVSALLNSSVVGALAAERCDRAKDSHFRYFGRSIAELPLPRLEHESSRYAELARISRVAHAVSPGEELDEVVADCYGISSSELDVLREYLEERLA